MKDQQRAVIVTLHRAGDTRIWVSVSLSLRPKEYVPGENYIDYSDDYRCNITPLDEEAARAFQVQAVEDAADGAAEGSDSLCPWGGAIMEGAHRGFRLQQTPDRGILLSRLEGCIGLDGDVAGILWAATLAVLLLLGGDSSAVETPGWKTTERIIK